jgi:hypothetical protein
VFSPPQAPRGNAACATMIGTLRRGLSGRLLIAGEHHLRRVMAGYLLRDHTSRPHRTLGQLPPAQAHAQPPQTGLAEHRVAESRSSAVSRMTIRSPPDRAWAISESGRSIVIAAFMSSSPTRSSWRPNTRQLTVKRSVPCA